VLKSYAVYGDLTKPNVLANLIKEVDLTQPGKSEISLFAYNNYSWDRLGVQYEQMISKLLY